MSDVDDANSVGLDLDDIDFDCISNTSSLSSPDWLGFHKKSFDSIADTELVLSESGPSELALMKPAVSECKDSPKGVANILLEEDFHASVSSEEIADRAGAVSPQEDVGGGALGGDGECALRPRSLAWACCTGLVAPLAQQLQSRLNNRVDGVGGLPLKPA